MSNEGITIWVCTDCLMHHANGECGSCSGYYGPHDEEPLNLVDSSEIAMGVSREEHDEECMHCVLNRIGERVADEYECDCETKTFSTSQCQGCGSYLYGERHAMTLWL